MFPLFFFAIGIIAAGIHILRAQKRNKPFIIETLLIYLMVFCMGIGSLFGAAFQIFQAPETATMIGWAPSPFLFEVAMSNVGLAIASLFVITWRGYYPLGPVIASTIFLYGAAYGHFVQINKGDMAPYNSGPFLYISDLFIPTVILVLAMLYHRCVLLPNKKK